MCGLLADRTTQEVAASEVAVQESELSQSNRILMFTCRVLDLRVGSSVLVHTHRISLSLQPNPPPPPGGSRLSSCTEAEPSSFQSGGTEPMDRHSVAPALLWDAHREGRTL